MFTNSLSYAISSEVLSSTMFFMILGIFLASAYTMFIKKFRGEFVLALINECAFDKDSAKSLSELGIKKSFLTSLFISKEFSFSPDYYVTEDGKYYINEEHIERLEAKYGNSGITIVQLIITIIAFFAVALFLAAFVPDVFDMFNGI